MALKYGWDAVRCFMCMSSQSTDPDELVRRSGRRYVPQRALITGAPGGPAVSGVTTISDVSNFGVGLQQTYPMAAGQRFMLLNGPDRTPGQIYEVVYCQEQSGVFKIGARCIPSADTPATPSPAHSVAS